MGKTLSSDILKTLSKVFEEINALLHEAINAFGRGDKFINQEAVQKAKAASVKLTKCKTLNMGIIPLEAIKIRHHLKLECEEMKDSAQMKQMPLNLYELMQQVARHLVCLEENEVAKRDMYKSARKYRFVGAVKLSPGLQKLRELFKNA
ncbi:hypothetical protein CRG98_019801 [Punica granatum]|uniref:Uncharacterized protein n=1 Tax=Punica granatum TaxID=22663 RepID=A0A2I0JU25_PUNGR|nr:hypothetical protein CRG98_019801 [Punica granatum]